ncbi:MAG: hypothetical protein ACJ79J_01105, partial [Gemmatimonadaceae bacterium]
MRIKNLVRSRASLLAALSLMVAACTDHTSPTGLATNVGARRDLAGGGSHPTRFSNRIKYRDQGLQPARGRSG